MGERKTDTSDLKKKKNEKNVFVYLKSKGLLSISFAKMPRRLASMIAKEGGHDQILIVFSTFFLYKYSLLILYV